MSESFHGIKKMLGLWTKDLRSCLGVLVMSNEDYVLGHFFAAASMLDSQFDKFEQEVEKAKLTNKQGYISIQKRPKLHSGTARMAMRTKGYKKMWSLC